MHENRFGELAMSHSPWLLNFMNFAFYIKYYFNVDI